MSRITKDPTERRQEILDTALKLFWEKGYEKTSMTEIAQAMQVAQGLCYRYFPSKEALFQTAVDQYAQRQVDQIASVLRKPGDLAAVSALRALLDKKIPVPGQVAVIGVDNSEYCDICYPKLTSLDNRLVEMSQEAARILLDSLEGRENPEKIMVFSRIVEREST